MEKRASNALFTTCTGIHMHTHEQLPHTAPNIKIYLCVPHAQAYTCTYVISNLA